MSQQARKSAVAWLSVGSNVTLVCFKVIVGVAIGSISVISEAVHSAVDLLAAIIALVAVKASGKPADKDHPFGHGKFENISGTIEALLIFLAAAWIIRDAVLKIMHPAHVSEPAWGVVVMLISAGMNLVVSNMLFKVGRESDSVALEADAWHLRTDVYTSIGVMVGLGVLLVGARVLPEGSRGWLLYVDPAAAIVVALMIIHAAYELTMKAARDLLDRNLPPEEESWIRTMVKDFHPTVYSLHGLKTRKAGSDRFVEFHLVVDGKMSVDESHDVSHEVAGRIEKQLANSTVTVHVEPCDHRCPEECRRRCLLSESERKKRMGKVVCVPGA